MEFTDKELVEECLKSNRRCQELLYLKFSRKMMGVCIRYTRLEADAEDLLQESFITVFRKLSTFRFEGSLEGWIRKIVLSIVFNHLRKQNYHYQIIEDNIAEEEKEEDVFADVEINQLVTAIRELSPGYRSVFNMHVIDGYTHKEIGEILGIAPGTSKSQFAQAKKALQKKLLIKQIQ
jgi:RNA polymerase sigma factor (sigma-70 family)